MPAPVELVTVHHEGGGAPTDEPRGAEGGYTYWLGVASWSLLRDVWSSYGTLNYNGESVDVCLSGDRHTGYPVTDNDLELLAEICQDARDRGYLADAPLVRAHRDSPGSSTACPGNFTMARWAEVVAACTGAATSEGDDMPLSPADLDAIRDVVDERIRTHFGDSAVSNPNAALNAGVSERLGLDRRRDLDAQTEELVNRLS